MFSIMWSTVLTFVENVGMYCQNISKCTPLQVNFKYLKHYHNYVIIPVHSNSGKMPPISVTIPDLFLYLMIQFSYINCGNIHAHVPLSETPERNLGFRLYWKPYTMNSILNADLFMYIPYQLCFLQGTQLKNLIYCMWCIRLSYTS